MSYISLVKVLGNRDSGYNRIQEVEHTGIQEIDDEKMRPRSCRFLLRVKWFKIIKLFFFELNLFLFI